MGCEDEGGGDLLALWRSGGCQTPPTRGDDSTLPLTYGEQAGEDPEGRNEKTEAEMPFLCNLYFTYAKLFITVCHCYTVPVSNAAAGQAVTFRRLVLL